MVNSIRICAGAVSALLLVVAGCSCDSKQSMITLLNEEQVGSDGTRERVTVKVSKGRLAELGVSQDEASSALSLYMESFATEMATTVASMFSEPDGASQKEGSATKELEALFGANAAIRELFAEGLWMEIERMEAGKYRVVEKKPLKAVAKE